MQPIIAAVVGLSVFHLVLGAISVCIGVVASIQAEVWLAHSVSPIWSGGFFILTGILGFACAKKKSAYLILCFTAFSVVSLVTAVVSIQLLRLGLVNHTNDGNTFQKEEKDFLIIVALATAGTECLVCIISSFVSCRVARAAKKELFKKREGTFSVQDICVNEDLSQSDMDMGEMNPVLLDNNGTLKTEYAENMTFREDREPTHIDTREFMNGFQRRDSAMILENQSTPTVPTFDDFSSLCSENNAGNPSNALPRFEHERKCNGKENAIDNASPVHKKVPNHFKPSATPPCHDSNHNESDTVKLQLTQCTSVETTTGSLVEENPIPSSSVNPVHAAALSPDIVLSGADGQTQIKVSFTEMSVQSGYIAQNRRRRSSQKYLRQSEDNKPTHDKRRPSSLKVTNSTGGKDRTLQRFHFSGENKKRKLPVIDISNHKPIESYSEETSSTTATKSKLKTDKENLNHVSTEVGNSSFAQNSDIRDPGESQQIQDESKNPQNKPKITRLSGKKGSNSEQEKHTRKSTEMKKTQRQTGKISIPNPSIKKTRRHSLHTSLDPIIEIPTLNAIHLPSIRSSPNLKDAQTEPSNGVLPGIAWERGGETIFLNSNPTHHLVDRPGHSPRVFSQELSCTVQEKPGADLDDSKNYMNM